MADPAVTISRYRPPQERGNIPDSGMGRDRENRRDRTSAAIMPTASAGMTILKMSMLDQAVTTPIVS
jgi:hypothetical protein